MGLQKTLESPLDCKEIKPINQPWIFTARTKKFNLKEINPEYLLQGLMQKLKLQYFVHLMQRTNSLERPWCWERLRAGGEGGDRGRDGWMASLTQWTWVWVNSGSWWWTERSGMLQSMGVGKSRTWLSNWTTTKVSQSPQLSWCKLGPRLKTTNTGSFSSQGTGLYPTGAFCCCCC